MIFNKIYQLLAAQSIRSMYSLQENIEKIFQIFINENEITEEKIRKIPTEKLSLLLGTLEFIPDEISRSSLRAQHQYFI